MDVCIYRTASIALVLGELKSQGLHQCSNQKISRHLYKSYNISSDKHNISSLLPRKEVGRNSATNHLIEEKQFLILLLAKVPASFLFITDFH